MKRYAALAAAALLLFIAVGCSNTNEEDPPASTADPVEASSEQTPDLAELRVSDLNEILAALDPSEAALTYHGETTNTCAAHSAIRAESYIETLKSFTWEEYHAPDEWDGSDEYRCIFTAPGATLTAYQSGYNNARPLHVVTESGEGMFTLPYLTDEDSGEAKQVSWMVFDAFQQWYNEAWAANLYGGGGTPLTAEELDWFTDYTASERTYYKEAIGYYSSASEISCFFTSRYNDPRDIDAQEFLAYCPGQDNLGAGDEEEFRLIQTRLDWRSGDDGHLFTVTELPVPCHRLPRSHINEILMKYAGITVEEMHTDWTEEALYIPETDCFYTFTSDYGPGMFIPCYGEKSGDTVTLWAAPSGDGKNVTSDTLVLQEQGENWQILSHQPTSIS